MRSLGTRAVFFYMMKYKENIPRFLVSPPAPPKTNGFHKLARCPWNPTGDIRVPNTYQSTVHSGNYKGTRSAWAFHADWDQGWLGMTRKGRTLSSSIMVIISSLHHENACWWAITAVGTSRLVFWLFRQDILCPHSVQLQSPLFNSRLNYGERNDTECTWCCFWIT